MRIEVTTHNEILEDPIVEIGRTIDDAKAKIFIPMVIFVDPKDERRRFANYLPAQPYVNDTWEDSDVQNAIDNYLKSIEVK